MGTEMEGRLRVGFVGGFRPPTNVRTLLENVRQLLLDQPTDFSCDLLMSDRFDGVDGYSKVDPGIQETDSASGTIRSLHRALVRYARRRDPDLLFQVTRFPAHGTATALAGWRTGTPTITRLAGDNFNEHRFARGLDETARTYALKNVISMTAVHLPETVIALGPTGERQLRRRGRRSGVVELPQPVDTDRFYPVEDGRRLRLRDDIDLPPPPTRVLLTVGRLSHRKGIHDLISTARRLDRADADVVWIVIGEGPIRPDLDAIPNVRALGRVPHARIPDYYRTADLLVHPSLHEGLPNTLLEATACGLPSIARDVGECATIASQTFDEANRLEPLVLEDYDRPTLPARFDADRLAKEYETLLVDATSR